MMRPLLLSAVVLLAGCARSEEAHYAQVDNTPLPAINASETGEDDDLTIGTWQNGLQEDQQVLEFGPVGATARFTLGCDDRRNLMLLWPGAPPEGDLPNMLVTVGSETRRLSVATVGGGTPMLRATLPANDPFMRVLTRASTRIVVRIGDTQPLVMPPSPTIAAYAQSCASGEARAAASALGNSVEPSGTVNVVAGNSATTNGQ